MRGRLTLWYASALALFTAGLAFAGYSLVRQATLAAADESLAQVVVAVGDALELESRDHSLDGRTIPLVLREFRFHDLTVSVLDRRGDTLYTSTDVLAGEPQASDSVRVIAARASPNGDELSDRLVDSTTALITAGTIAGDVPLRLATIERSVGGRAIRIGALRALATQERVLHRLRLALFAATPLLILFFAFGGSLLAQAGLRPFAVMASRASRIGATTLHQRLPVFRPDDEAGRLALAFNAVVERLDEAFDQRRQFVADASHELRTPVTIVSGEAQLALSRDDRTPEELRSALRVIRREAERLQRIVGDLFLLARADAHETMLAMAPLYLGELAAECVASVSTIAAARGVTVTYAGSLELPMKGDENLLRRLVTNLLDNAIKHTPAGGRIEVTTESRDDTNLLRVSDTGPGIPLEAQPRIFDRFYRVTDPAGPSPERGASSSGAGLGLAIAQWVARSHGGELSLERSDSTGSVFLVRLPR